MIRIFQSVCILFALVATLVVGAVGFAAYRALNAFETVWGFIDDWAFAFGQYVVSIDAQRARRNLLHKQLH